MKRLCLLLGGLVFMMSAHVADAKEMKTAVFAGGCFWCMEKPFDVLDGVISTVSGYTGGHVENPTYKQVSSGKSGHKEVLQVTYDPQKISYEELLDVFWVNVDPFDGVGQFCDKGEQYTSAVYYQNEAEQQAALASRQKLLKDGLATQEVQTQVLPAATFYPAEDYHQDYYQKNPIRYRYYRGRCGRDARLKELWGERAVYNGKTH